MITNDNMKIFKLVQKLFAKAEVSTPKAKATTKK